jgi:tetratricopeptide (TPR) repeat protein
VAERKQAAPDLARRLGSVLRNAQDRNLGRRAVRAGLLSEQDLSGPAGVEELLRAKGVPAGRIKELQDELDREDYALFRPDRAMPPEVLALLGEPDRRMAEFVRVSRLGQGGIGEVWKAWDARLGRWVAIKLPTATPDQEQATERFTREALAAARLSHPNIVSIHRVAEENGRCFIVMQYVEGKSLRGMKLELRKALETMRDVAFAVHYAHEHGVIHRDLKPGNIVIGDDGRPFVLDFGLAHLEEAGRVQSREGLVAGTASYMSPEQARGEPAAREPATDVYSLGASLYEIVTGRAPFDGASFAETLQKVLNNDLESPRKLSPSLPREVEIVILKAMDKDPRRRYATAKALAEDLDRCLKGEPILAGAISQTIRRSVRRNRGLLWAAAAAVLFLGAWRAWLFSSQNAARAEAEARAREKDRELRGICDMANLSIQAMLRLRRASANEGMSEFFSKVESACTGARQKGHSSPELDWLLGRGYRAMMEDAKALQCQERALALDPKYAPSLYEKFVLLTINLALPGRVSEAETAELAKLRGHDLLDQRTLEGMFALSSGESPRARAILEKVVAQDPGRVEAWETLARTHLAPFVELAPPREQEEAYRKAQEVLSLAVVQDRGYVPFWMKRGELTSSQAGVLRQMGKDPVQVFQSAEDDFWQAIRLRPSAEAWTARARLRVRYGVHRAALGGNPSKEFDLADEDFEQAARLSPKDASVVEGRSFALRSRADYKVSKGESPLRELETMESVAAAFLADRPLPPGAWANVALLWAAQALYRGGLGEDPTSDYARADEAFAKTGETTSVAVSLPWARVRVEHARLRVRRHREPSAELEGACENLRHVPDTPWNPEAWLTKAMFWRTKGEQRVLCGSDPSKEFEQSLGYLSRILDTNPVSADGATERGHLELSWGRYRTKLSDRRGGQDHYGKAVRFFEEAVKINDSLSGPLREWLREARRGMFGAY